MHSNFFYLHYNFGGQNLHDKNSEGDLCDLKTTSMQPYSSFSCLVLHHISLFVYRFIKMLKNTKKS